MHMKRRLLQIVINLLQKRDAIAPILRRTALENFVHKHINLPCQWLVKVELIPVVFPDSL